MVFFSNLLALDTTLQVLFEGTRAVGVEYVKDGRLHTMRARKEVILSAGTIGSPHILMLSGVGHKQHLLKFGVKTEHNTISAVCNIIVPGPGGFYLPRNETSYNPMHFDLEVI